MISFAIKLLILLNPFGCLERIRTLLRHVSMSRSKTFIVREWAVALSVMLITAYCGRSLFFHLGIDIPAIQTAGGCALFISALAMLFPKESVESDKEEGYLIDKAPFIVPLAIPQMAGPGILTNIMIETKSTTWQATCGAVLIVAFFCLVFWRALIFHEKILSQKVLLTLDRFMGFLFITIAINMIMSGIKSQFSL